MIHSTKFGRGIENSLDTIPEYTLNNKLNVELKLKRIEADSICMWNLTEASTNYKLHSAP